jgi:hypothetical protein
MMNSRDKKVKAEALEALKSRSGKVIAKATETAFARAAERSFQFPFTTATVGRNGAFMFCRYHKTGHGIDLETLAEHEDETGYEFPINMLMVDATGKELRVTMGGEGSDRITFH